MNKPEEKVRRRGCGHSRIAPALLTVLLLAIAGGVFLLSRKIDPPRLPQTSFDSPRWIAGNQAVRGSMVDDLIERKLLLGLDKAAVEALLGPADHATESSLGYTLDFGTRFCGSPWTYTLSVHLDNSFESVENVYVND